MSRAEAGLRVSSNESGNGANCLTRLSKKFGNIEAVRSIDLVVENGECAVFFGPSGCGKTTTLRMIAGLEEINQWSVSFDGKVVNDLHRIHSRRTMTDPTASTLAGSRDKRRISNRGEPHHARSRLRVKCRRRRGTIRYLSGRVIHVG